MAPVPSLQGNGQISTITQGTSAVSFGYDVFGRRVSRTAGGTTTAFQLLGQYFPLLEKQGSTTTAAYTYGNELVRMNGEFPLDDGSGSERTVTNSSQTVTGTLNLDNFGNQVGSTSSSSDPYTYAGEFARRAPTDEGGCSAARQRGPAPGQFGYRNDGDAGLTLVGARYYDAQVGRFASRDTWLDQAPYTYCLADPLDWVDPSGHMPWWVPWPGNPAWQFNHDDWQQIGDGIIGIGAGEVGTGGVPLPARAIGWGSPISPGMKVTLPPGSPGGGMNEGPPGYFEPYPPGEYAGGPQITITIGAGLVIGGGIAILIGKAVKAWL